MWISFHLDQSKYTKISLQEITSICPKLLELFYVPLYTEFLSNLYKNFQIASIYDTNVEYQILYFCYDFLSYAENRYIDIHIDPHTHTHTHRPIAKNAMFGFREPYNS